jgi:hypothetical protein
MQVAREHISEAYQSVLGAAVSDGPAGPARPPESCLVLAGGLTTGTDITPKLLLGGVSI